MYVKKTKSLRAYVCAGGSWNLVGCVPTGTGRCSGAVPDPAAVGACRGPAARRVQRAELWEERGGLPRAVLVLLHGWTFVEGAVPRGGPGLSQAGGGEGRGGALEPADLRRAVFWGFSAWWSPCQQLPAPRAVGLSSTAWPCQEGEMCLRKRVLL